MSSVVIAETGEVIEAMTATEAERITLRISLKLGTLADTYETVMPLIRDAIVRRAHEALGYASPGAYVSDRFGDSMSRLGVEMRREVVRELTEAGMSTRAIAPVVGVSQKTVVKDTQVIPEVSPRPIAEQPTTSEPRSRCYGSEEESAPSKVTGLDGKVYTRPEVASTREPALQNYRERRRPLADGFRDASLDLAKLITRLENLAADDRLPKNRDEVARYANDLIRARDALSGVIDHMSHGKGTAE